MEEPCNTLHIVKGSFYKYRVTRFSQFIPVKVEKMLRKSQPQFREKLRKLRLRKKSVFLIKKKVYICLNLMRPHVMEQVRNFRCTLSFNKEPRYKEPICRWWLVICENSRWAPQAYLKMGPFSKPNFTSRNFNSELNSYAESSWWLILAIHHMQDFYQKPVYRKPWYLTTQWIRPYTLSFPGPFCCQHASERQILFLCNYREKLALRPGTWHGFSKHGLISRTLDLTPSYFDN